MNLATARTTPCEATRRSDVTITADGYAIATERYCAMGQFRGYLIIAGAIGVPQQFYRRFAEFAQVRGYEVTTFDYRGIGRSAPATLRGFQMDFSDWGRRDFAAVVDDVADEADGFDAPLYVVGHSFGGHAFGMLPNHARVRACFTYGTGAGWHGWMPFSERLKVLALWNLLGPVLTWWKQFLPWSALGMGEDLPLDVYRQWRRWCRFPHFFLDDPEIGLQMQKLLASVRTPMIAASSVDDRWSPPCSRDAILTGYRNARIRTIDYRASELNVGELGHMDFFRARAASLWPEVLQELEATTCAGERKEFLTPPHETQKILNAYQARPESSRIVQDEKSIPI